MELTASNPRRRANRSNSGLANRTEMLRKTRAMPTEPGAEWSPLFSRSTNIAKANRHKTSIRAANPAATHGPKRMRAEVDGAVVGGLAIHSEPFHLSEPSAETAGCHWVPSQK
jgi:hypothetical protein